jgi:hypothetical protein
VCVSGLKKAGCGLPGAAYLLRAGQLRERLTRHAAPGAALGRRELAGSVAVHVTLRVRRGLCSRKVVCHKVEELIGVSDVSGTHGQ